MKVYFDELRQHIPNRSLPPGAWKGQYLVNLIQGPEVQLVKDFSTATIAQLEEVHDPRMVEDLLRGRRRNGYGTLLDSHLCKIRVDCGSFISAAVEAYLNKECVLSPTSGFHHAGYSRVSGYCTFNGIIMAINELQRWNAAVSIAVIDGDAHWGDGVVELLDRHRLLNVNYVSLADCNNLNHFLAQSSRAIYNSHVVFYQAGADAHIADSLGSGTLTPEELIQRDQTVFKLAKDQGVGVVWNLAGGYGAPTVKSTMMAHYETWKAALSVFGARANLSKSTPLET